MDAVSRIERTLAASLERVEGKDAPPLLAAAMHHAVFPRGARIRPRLCLAVAAACGGDDPAAAEAAAAAIELMHCASLVHDDLPAFDNADLRRGRPSVHRAFGEPLAVLAGDALIVLAFQTLVWGTATRSPGSGRWCMSLAKSTGMPSGICGRAGLGMRAERRSGAISAAEDRARCSRRPPKPAPRRRVSRRKSGANSGCAWARPIRWPTISPTCYQERRTRQADRSGRGARAAECGAGDGHGGCDEAPGSAGRGGCRFDPGLSGAVGLAGVDAERGAAPAAERS